MAVVAINYEPYTIPLSMSEQDAIRVNHDIQMSYHGRNVTFGSLSWIVSFTLDIWDIPHFGPEFCSPAMNRFPGYEMFRTALI